MVLAPLWTLRVGYSLKTLWGNPSLFVKNQKSECLYCVEYPCECAYIYIFWRVNNRYIRKAIISNMGMSKEWAKVRRTEGQSLCRHPLHHPPNHPQSVSNALAVCEVLGNLSYLKLAYLSQRSIQDFSTHDKLQTKGQEEWHCLFHCPVHRSCSLHTYDVNFA